MEVSSNLIDDFAAVLMVENVVLNLQGTAVLVNLGREWYALQLRHRGTLLADVPHLTECSRTHVQELAVVSRCIGVELCRVDMSLPPVTANQESFPHGSMYILPRDKESA